MKDIWLDVSKTIKSEELTLFKELMEVLDSIEDIKYLLIGAWARNYVLQKYKYMAPRQTLDIDFALVIESWGQFQVLSDRLIDSGWIKSSIHTFKNKNGFQIDLIPFGNIALNNTLEFPPDNNPILDTTGFQEALDSAVYVQLSDQISLPIASYLGLVILKFISWSDRDSNNRRKDANDLYHLFKVSLEVYFDECYKRDILLEKYDFQTHLISSYLLGEQISLEFGGLIKNKLISILSENTAILFEMIEHENENSIDVQQQVIKAFVDGLTS